VIPVDQTRFGDPDGNCLAACLASLLELPLDDVPHFVAEGWYSALERWLEPRGLWPLCFVSPTQAQLERVLGYAIVSGPTERGLLHATVWRAGLLVHDPHPSRAGLLAVEDVIVLVPFEPGRVSVVFAGGARP
jgi:hypothetical protein